MMQRVQHQALKIVTISSVHLPAFDNSLVEARACWMGQRVSMAAMAMAKPEVSDVVLVGTIILYSYTHGDFLGVSDYELVHGTP